MANNTLVIMAPIMPTENHLDQIKKNVAKLNLGYNLKVYDPLMFKGQSFIEGKQFWHQQLSIDIQQGVRAFIGFSFGAVLLLQLLSDYSDIKLKLALVSMPYPMRKPLKENLSDVRKMCQLDQTNLAIQQLYKKVYLPLQSVPNSFQNLDLVEAKKRFIFGFDWLFELNEESVKISNNLSVMHLLGAESKLVNIDTIYDLNEVPRKLIKGSGMRVLEDATEISKAELFKFYNT